MWPLGMIMLEKLATQVVHVPLTEDHEIIEAFLLNALDKSLDIGRRVGRAIGRPAGVNPGVLQRGIEASREFTVPIVHNDLGSQLLGPYVANEGLGLLGDPGFVGMLRGER